MRRAQEFGLAPTTCSSTPGAVIQRSRGVAARLSRGVQGVLKKNKVAAIWGKARLTTCGRITLSGARSRGKGPAADKPAVALGPGDHSANHIVVASGARLRILLGLKPTTSGYGPRSKRFPRNTFPSRYWSSGRAPVEGCELDADERARIEGRPGRNAFADPARRGRQHREIRPGAIPEAWLRDPDVARIKTTHPRSGCRVVATVENGGGQADGAVDAIVVAAGVQGNVDGLRLEDLGVRIERRLHCGGRIRPD
jgi:dihydrolipoamide dehydrogenase